MDADDAEGGESLYRCGCGSEWVYTEKMGLGKDGRGREVGVQVVKARVDRG